MSNTEKQSIEIVKPIAEEATFNGLAQIAGSIRRNRPEVGDIDLVIAEADFVEYCKQFEKWADSVKRTKKSGKIKCGFKNGARIELYVGPRNGLGALMLYATGSPMFNILMRKKAKSLGYLLNQYGLFKDGKWFCGETEESIFSALGMEFKQPEEREVE